METKYFNIEALTSLIGNDKTMLTGMLENIVSGALKKFEEFNQNYDKQDWNLVRDNAHFLKSNFRYLGNPRMSTILKTIEMNSHDAEKRTEVAELMKEFNDNFPLVIKEVKAYLNFLKN
mgnify:CR=1 FL=1